MRILVLVLSGNTLDVPLLPALIHPVTSALVLFLSGYTLDKSLLPALIHPFISLECG